MKIILLLSVVLQVSGFNLTALRTWRYTRFCISPHTVNKYLSVCVCAFRVGLGRKISEEELLVSEKSLRASHINYVSIHFIFVHSRSPAMERMELSKLPFIQSFTTKPVSKKTRPTG